MEKLVDIAKNGDEIEMLKTLRLTLAQELDYCESGRDIASLSRQFVEVSSRITELEKLKPKERSTPLDRIKKKTKAPVKR